MDISSFTVNGGIQATELQMPKASASIPAIPSSISEQPVPSPLVDVVADTEEQPVEETASTEQASDTEQQVDAVQVEEQEEPQEEQEKPEQQRQMKFSVLARKEAQLNRERERLKAERAKIDAELAAVKEFEAKRAKAKLNPIEALSQLGLTYEEVSEYVVNGNKPTVSAEVQSVRDEIDRMRKEQEQAREEAEKLAQQRLEQEREAILHQFNQDAIDFVESNASKFEYTIANDGAHYVPEIIEKHFFKTGELLSIDKAAEIVEAHFEGIAERVAKAEKFKAKTSSKAKPTSTVASVPATQEVAATQTKRPATLTNSMTASAPAQVTTTSRSENDRIRAALARLEGK